MIPGLQLPDSALVSLTKAVQEQGAHLRLTVAQRTGAEEELDSLIMAAAAVVDLSDRVPHSAHAPDVFVHDCAGCAVEELRRIWERVVVTRAGRRWPS